MREDLDLSVIIPALNEGPNLKILLPQLLEILDDLNIRYEFLVVTNRTDVETAEAVARCRARIVEQRERGYGAHWSPGFWLHVDPTS